MEELKALKIISKHGSAYLHDFDDGELEESIQEIGFRNGVFPWTEIVEIISATISLVPVLQAKELNTKLIHSLWNITRYLERTSKYRLDPTFYNSEKLSDNYWEDLRRCYELIEDCLFYVLQGVPAEDAFSNIASYAAEYDYPLTSSEIFAIYASKLDDVDLHNEYMEDEIVICEALAKADKIPDEIRSTLSRLRDSKNSELKGVVLKILSKDVG